MVGAAGPMRRCCCNPDRVVGVLGVGFKDFIGLLGSECILKIDLE